MIFRYFRSNQTVLLLALPLIVILSWLIHFFDSTEAVQYQGFLFELLKKTNTFHPFVFKSIALILVGVQALLFTNLLNKTEVFSKVSYVSLVVFVVTASMFSFYGGLEPALFANFFILLALNSLLRIYHQNSAIGLSFDVGFWLGMAIIFEPALVLLVVATLVSILILRAADWRELFFLLVGSALPTVFLSTICFVADSDYQLSDHYFKIQKFVLPFSESALFIAYLITGLFLLFIALIYYYRSLAGLILRIRKMRVVIGYFCISLLLVYAYLLFTPSHFISNQLLIIPFAVFLSYLYTHTSRKILFDFLFYVWVILWLIFVYKLYFS